LTVEIILQPKFRLFYSGDICLLFINWPRGDSMPFSVDKSKWSGMKIIVSAFFMSLDAYKPRPVV